MTKSRRTAAEVDGRRPGRVVALPGAGAEPDPPSGNLPPELTSFVGRRREIHHLRSRLAAHRLVTLTGPGGCGKSRLARRVAAAVRDRFADGVWLIELAALPEAGFVEPAVGSVLGISEVRGRTVRELLVDHLEGMSALLVLDNCEHLIDACAELVDFLLHACPALHVLATSREALRVGGETPWLVPPLASSEPAGSDTVGELLSSEAAQLFVQRASAAVSAFTPGEENASAIAELCHRLNGMPLAIELAAARVGLLTVPQIAERLRDPLGLLTGGPRTASPRQQSLRATLQWSYQLLDPPGRRLLGRLSVFTGGWTVEGAEEVTAGEGIDSGEILDLLAALAAKSLIQGDPSAGCHMRYTMLEPLRQFGQELLEQNTETERTRDRHAEHYLRLVTNAMAGSQSARLALSTTEQGNLRAALGWLLKPHDEPWDERAEKGLRLAALLAQGLYWGADANEGRMWLERGLSRPGPPTSMRFAALFEAGWMTTYRGEYERARALLEQALSTAVHLGESAGAAASLALLGDVALQQGEQSELRARAAQAERLRAETNDRYALAHLGVFLSKVAMTEGRLALAEERAEASLALSRELADPRCVAVALHPVGIVALERGDHERATACYGEFMEIVRPVNKLQAIVYGLRGLAAAAGLGGDRARAARLWGAATALGDEIGMPLSRFDRAHPDYEGLLTACGALADKAAFEQGRAMTVEQAVEEALAAPEQSAVARSGRTSLTDREREVLGRLAQGLTNKEIAEALTLSVATVERHLATVYRKVDARGRAEAAVYALRIGLVPPSQRS